MDEKQRYSYKPKTERHSYREEKIVDTVVSTLPREQSISSRNEQPYAYQGVHLGTIYRCYLINSEAYLCWETATCEWRPYV